MCSLPMGSELTRAKGIGLELVPQQPSGQGSGNGGLWWKAGSRKGSPALLICQGLSPLTCCSTILCPIQHFGNHFAPHFHIGSEVLSILFLKRVSNFPLLLLCHLEPHLVSWVTVTPPNRSPKPQFIFHVSFYEADSDVSTLLTFFKNKAPLAPGSILPVPAFPPLSPTLFQNTCHFR